MITASVRFYFELPEEEADYASIDVYEFTSMGGVGSRITTLPVSIEAGKDFIDIPSSYVSDAFDWFKLKLVDSSRNEIFDTDFVLCEDTETKVQLIRSAVKDTGDSPAFSDEELISKVRMAGYRFKNLKSLSDLDEREWPIIEILVRIDICHVLAFDYAKYQRLEVPGGTALSKDDLYNHYIAVATKLESYYEKITAEIAISAGDEEETIHVSNLTRDSYATGMEETELGTIQGSYWNAVDYYYKLSRDLTI